MEEQSNLHTYMIVIFIILLLSGMGKRYAEYAKEQ
jgi:hypothetical protein